MKTALKIIAVVVPLLVIAVVALFIWGVSSVDALAKQAIERGGTYALGVETTVERVELGLTSGTADVTGLRVANPRGFETDHFMTLAAGSARVDYDTIRADTLVMPEIRLDGIDLILDKGRKPSNYNQILENLKRFEKDEPTTPDEQQPGKKLVIERLVIEQTTVRVANMPGVSLAVGDVAVTIPEIVLTDVGREESMTPGEVINLVVKTVLAAAVEAGGGIIPTDVLNELASGLGDLESLQELGVGVISDLKIEEQIGQVSEQIDKAAKDVQGEIDKATEEIKGKVDEATEDLRNIFGKPKQDDGSGGP